MPSQVEAITLDRPEDDGPMGRAYGSKVGIVECLQADGVELGETAESGIIEHSDLTGLSGKKVGGRDGIDGEDYR
jgi:hypothetical protein